MATKPAKHGRDHCPGGEDPIPCLPGNRPWIVLENLGQTLASGSFSASLLTDAYWDPRLVTTPSSGNDPIFDLNLQSSGGFDYWELTTRVEGWFTLELVHLWSNITSLTTSPAYGTQQINFNTTGIPFFHDRQPGGATDWANVVTEINGYAYIQCYRTIWLPGSKTWPVNVKQTTGDNRDCSGHLKVWYEQGNFGGAGDNAGWDFETV